MPAVLAFLVCVTVQAGKRIDKDKLVDQISYDESAEKVNIFEGMEQGVLDVKVIPEYSLSASIYIENTSEVPLTVEIPKAVAATHTLKQFGAGVGGGGNQGGGGAQSTGGSAGGFGSGLGGGGGNSFSVPAGKIVKIPYDSVCLEHGKKEPNSRMTYHLVPVETVTDNAAVIELLAELSHPNVDRMSAQAAAWRMQNKLSWQYLSSKMKNRNTPYFTRQQIQQGMKFASLATFAALDKEKEEETSETVKEVPQKKSIRQLNLESINK